MKLLVPIVSASLAFSISLPSFAVSRAASTEEMKQKLAALATNHSRIGGLLTRPGKGHFAIVSAQKLYSKDDLAKYIKMYSGQMQFPLEYREEDGAVSVASATQRRQSLNVDVAVFLVDDPALPMSLVAVEEKWAIINISKVIEKGVEKSVNDKRLQREFSRTFKALFAGAEKAKDRMAVAKSADLDQITSDPIDAQTLFGIINGLHSYGLVPPRTVPYRRACKEGWAPAPTNDVQKAIWKEVHEMPSKPIKIEYNEKRDKGK